MITINPTPILLENLYWITLIAVIVSSASGVLKAGFKQFDLFGVIIIAIATGLGGGSLRRRRVETVYERLIIERWYTRVVDY